MRSFGLFFLAFVLIGFPSFGLAKLGVGVNTGKITIDEPLKAGGVYELPPLVVLNTGDEPSQYGVSVEYHVGQEQRDDMGARPLREWFEFTPETFHLDPGGAQKIAIQITLPVKTPPGQYFAYLEGHPVYIDTGAGVARIGIAAAGKLHFTVAPANLLQGLYWRVLHFWNAWSPWTYVALVILAGAVLLLLAKRFLSFNIGLRKKPAEVPAVEQPKKRKPRKKKSPS